MPHSNLSFFFTSWSDAKLGGGRDPLGLQSIWSNIARLGIQGVNSVSGDIMGWRTLLAAAGVAEWLKPHSNVEEHQELMQRFERLVAYVRIASNTEAKEGVRGSTRVSKTLSEQGFTQIQVVRGETNYQEILHDQRQTGVVGQIVGPAQNLNLLNSKFYLTLEGNKLWELIKPTIEPFKKILKQILIEGKPLQEAIKQPILSLIGPKFISPEEVHWYEEYLLQANGIKKDALEHWQQLRQISLVRIMRELKEKQADAPINLETLLSIAPPDPDVREWLQDIQYIETVLGTADKIFRWLLRECKDEKHLVDLQKKLEEQGLNCQNSLQIDSRAWKRLEQATFSSYGSDRGEAILGILRLLTTTDSFEEYLHQLILLNQTISKYRKKSAWMEARGKNWVTLSVYLPESNINLSGTRMEHSYYLENFSRLVYACKYEERK